MSLIYSKRKVKSNMYEICLNRLDPFSDCIGIYVIKKGQQCIVTDDGYTNYNLLCLGKDISDNVPDISITGKWKDVDKLIYKLADNIADTYSTNLGDKYISKNKE
jgi:hypothetical protein